MLGNTETESVQCPSSLIEGYKHRRKERIVTKTETETK